MPANSGYYYGKEAYCEKQRVVGSGSATSWMVDKLIENQGGLHARITANIYIRPFNLKETEDYLRLFVLNRLHHVVLPSQQGNQRLVAQKVTTADGNHARTLGDVLLNDRNPSPAKFLISPLFTRKMRIVG